MMDIQTQTPVIERPRVLTLLAIHHIVAGSIIFLVGISFLIFFPAIGNLADKLIGTVLLIIFSILGISAVTAGIGILKLKKWAWYLMMVLSVCTGFLYTYILHQNKELFGIK